VRVEQKILRVQVSGDVVERVPLVQKDPRELLLAHEIDRVGAARLDRERRHVDARDHDDLRGASGETHHPPKELLLLLAPRLARHVRRQDSEDLVLRERRFAVRIELQPDHPEHGARADLEHPERRVEHEVRRAKERNAHDRGLGRALDRDELRHELAQEHVEHRENPERHRDDDPVPRRPELAPRRLLNELVAELGHRRLADPSEAEARERDRELRHAEVPIEVQHRLLELLFAPGGGLLSNVAGRAELDERELRRHEKPVQKDEEGRDTEPEHDVRPSRFRPCRASQPA
jgi:hypothetical protein